MEKHMLQQNQFNVLFIYLVYNKKKIYVLYIYTVVLFFFSSGASPMLKAGRQFSFFRPYILSMLTHCLRRAQAELLDLALFHSKHIAWDI